MSAPDQTDQDDDELTPEEEDFLEERLAKSYESEREGRLIPHEALFPPKRLAG